ncbi:addiction module antitoxin [Phenylobacterium sp.]|uniref:ribbon-helix-helix domain-containing protein n=1 Tax=Phenylobacterium sp. TaxID=1871053 RepID=UPI0025E984AE|nr:addiction module antitoxin [Phenylobacterium sp.]
MTLNVRVSGELQEFVTTNIGADGRYENVSEYVRDLIRRDMDRADHIAFERLKAELQAAFAAPDDAFVPLADVEDVIRRGRERLARPR